MCPPNPRTWIVRFDRSSRSGATFNSKPSRPRQSIITCVSSLQSDGAEPGFFVTGSIGVNLVQDINLPVAPPVNVVRLEFDPGLRGDATVGYTFFANPSIAIAAAGEVGFMYNSLDQGTGNGV